MLKWYQNHMKFNKICYLLDLLYHSLSNYTLMSNFMLNLLILNYKLFDISYLSEIKWTYINASFI